MKFYFSIILLALVSCGQKDHSQAAGELPTDSIPKTRTNVKTQAVASYSQKTNDKLNDWRFAVDLYETPATFKFLMKIEYETLNESDTITIPDFGIEPVVEIQKGEGDYSCIIGFKGKKGEFLRYKEVSVKNKQLKIATIQHYRTAKFRKK
jgi:hypothetical protein